MSRGHKIAGVAVALFAQIVLFYSILCYAGGMPKKEEDRVGWAEQLCQEFAALSRGQWAKLRAHPKFVPFMAEYLQALCLDDLWWHMRYGCYHKSMRYYHPPLHGNGPGGLANFLMTWEVEEYGQMVPVNLQVVEMSRDHNKTQQAAVADLTWQYARNPDIRVLGRGYKDDKIEEVGKAVREILESDLYQRRYPHVRPKKRKNGQVEQWNDLIFTLERSQPGIKTASWEACGLKSDPTSGHYDFALYDDIEIRMNAENPKLREDMEQKFKDDVSLLEGPRRLIGTPWNIKAVMAQAMRREGIFKDLRYALWCMPCVVPVFKQPFGGQECTLDTDQVTVYVPGGGFPTVEGDLSLCQARLAFWSEAAQDTIEEVREVVDNGPNWFRVNRPFGAVLGQPLKWHVGHEKPVAPNRFTLDDVDLQPAPHERTTKCVRLSLPQKKLALGSADFNAQWMMKPVNREQMLLNPAFVKHVKWDEQPKTGRRIFYRSMDFASGDATDCATAITTGYWHETGLYIVRCQFADEMSAADKLLEMFLGQLWVRETFAGARLEHTTWEKAAIERTLGELLPIAEKDPEAFFAPYASQFSKLFNCSFELMTKGFAGKGRINVPNVSLTRGNAGKNLRILQLQAPLEAGQIHWVEGCKHWESFERHCESFRMDSKEDRDLIETVRDLAIECRRVQPEHVTEVQRNEMAERQAAALRGRLSHRVAVGGWRGC